MSGELKPNTHLNIKMTLAPSKYPTYFEGEIQCSIDWENNAADHKEETKSVHTNTNVPECSEYLFLRLRKRTKIVRLIIFTMPFLDKNSFGRGRAPQRVIDRERR